jgi:hypothetical protein
MWSFKKILSRFRGVTVDGVCIGDWIYGLFIYTTRNYKHSTLWLISTLHKSLHAKYSSACSVFTSRCLVTALNSGDSSASVLSSSLSSDWTVNWIIAPPLLNLPWRTQLIALTVLVIISLHGPRRKRRSTIVVCVLVAAGTFLPSFCPKTVCITPLIKNPLLQ